VVYKKLRKARLGDRSKCDLEWWGSDLRKNYYQYLRENFKTQTNY
jgi:hypothetical protein